MSATKKIITHLGLWALKQSTISICNFNKEAQEEIDAWPKGFRIKIAVKNQNLAIAWQKTPAGLKSIPSKGNDFDLIVYFKTLDTAFQIVTTLSSVPEAFAQNRIQAYGFNSDSMILIRLLNIVQSYLFPPILSKRILKRVPKFSAQQYIGRIRVYILGILFAY